MNRSIARASFVTAIGAFLLASGASGQLLVLDDPLQGSTKGTRSGGDFVAGGWQVTGKDDSILWHVPTISKGAVEWQVKGLAPRECRAGMEDKTELFHMYDYIFGDSDANYNGGYRDNPYKHFVRKIGCLDPNKVDAMELVWKIGDNYEEPDTPVLSWSAGATYLFREEWGPEGGNSVFRTYRDGVLLKTTSVPGSYAPAGHSVRIAASTRRAADAGAPVDAVFSNIKVWDLSVAVPAAPQLSAPAQGEVVRQSRAFVNWSGGGHGRYRLRINTSNSPDSGIAWDSGDVASARSYAWTGSLGDRKSYYPFVKLASAAGWGPWSTTGRWFRVDTSSPPPSAGAVRVLGNSLADSGGPFLGLGATYMQALRRAKYDRARLESDLAFLSRQGFNYVRVLSMVGWNSSWEGYEIAPVSFQNQLGHAVAAWPDYWSQFRDLIDIVASHGMRAQVTIFADAQLLPLKASRIEHMASLLANLAGREEKVILLEVANEAWQNGFPGSQGVADVREFGQYLAVRTAIPVALSATGGGTNASLEEMYAGSAADIATEHFTRDIGTSEGGWLPVRDPWRVASAAGVPPVSSNEPIGPGSSVNNEKDPIKLVSAAVFAYVANLPMYVFHSSAGVKGLEPFEDMAGVGGYAHLREVLPPDLASWVRNDGLQPEAPFTVFCQGQANKYWPDVPGATSGCDRNCGAAKGGEFVTFPMGILAGGVELEARRTMMFQVLNPLTGAVAYDLARNAGERFTLVRGPGAYIIKGTFHESLPHKALSVKGAGPILVDGDPGDWDLDTFGTPLRGGQGGSGDYAVVGFDGATLSYGGYWTGGVLPADPADHTARAYVRHDAEALYFLVRSDDSDIRYPNGVDMNWANDCVEFYIDPGDDGGSLPLAGSTSDIQLVIDATNRTNVYMSAPAYRAQVLGGVTSAVARDSTGWWLEVRIEKGALSPGLPALGAIGLDFNFRDNDGNNDPAQTTVYTWSDTSSGTGFPSKVPDRWAQALLEELPAGMKRIANDCNRDMAVDISDPICFLAHMFLGNPLNLDCGEEDFSNPAVMALLDATGDGEIDLSDPVFVLEHLFLAGPEPLNGGTGKCRLFVGCETEACPAAGA